MNKFEMELNENKAKAFFVRHGEKLGLVVATGLLGTFAYLGAGLKPDLQDRTPTKLEATVTTAENHINNGRWEELRPFRLAIDNTVEKLDANKVQVAASDYVFDYLLARRSASAPLRSDPPLLPVTAPETSVNRVSIADTSTSQDRHPLSLLASLNLADPAVAGGVGSDPTMNDGSSSSSKTKEKFDLGAVAAVTGVDPNKAGLKDLDNPIPVDRYVATVKFIFPFKQVYTDFRGAFRGSIGYDATNDRFVIRYLEIQRRVNGGEWVDYTNEIREQEKTYVVSAPNPFDDKYMDRVLTRSFPPVLQHDYYGVSRHSMIPEIQPEDPASADAASTASNSGRRDGAGSATGRSGPPASAAGRSGPPAGAGSMGRSGPPAGAGSMGRSGPPAGASGRSGMSGMSGRSGASGQSGTASAMVEETVDLVDYKLVRFCDPTVEPGNNYEYRVRYWIYDPNNPIKMDGYVAASKEQGPTLASATATDERLMTTDEDEDLENLVLQSNVKIDYLTPEVRERLSLEGSLARPLPVLRNCRPSPWSEPTPLVRVQPVLGGAFVSSAVIPTVAKSSVDNKEVRFSIREGAVRMVSAIWDSTFGIQIPIVLENVYPGSVLGGQAVTRVLDPITQEYKRLENNDGSIVAARTAAPGYKGSSGMVLVDFLGGREIANASESKTKFKVPTEALLLDSAGQLVVKSAVRDARDLTWLSGEVLREDGLINKLAESSTAGGDGEDDRETGRGNAGRSGQSGRSGRSGFSGGNNSGPPAGGASGGRSGPPGGR